MQTKPERTTFPSGHRLAGKPAWFFPESKRFVPVVAGGEGENDPPAPPPAPAATTPPASSATTTPPPPPPAADKTLSQDEVNGLIAREKAAAEKRMADALGMTVEEAKAVIARQKDAEKAAMTDAERARTEAQEAKAQADKDRAEAARDRHDAAVERALTAAGVKEDRLAKAQRLLDVEVGADKDAITAAVSSLKKDTPEFFGAGTAPAPRSPSSSPSGTPPRPKPEDDAYKQAFERGRTAARPRRVQLGANGDEGGNGGGGGGASTLQRGRR